MINLFILSLSKKISKLADVPEEGKASMARTFLAGMKKTLSQVNFNRIVQALQSYKTTDNLEVLLTETAFLSEDTSTQSLLRGLSSVFNTVSDNKL